MKYITPHKPKHTPRLTVEYSFGHGRALILSCNECKKKIPFKRSLDEVNAYIKNNLNESKCLEDL